MTMQPDPFAPAAFVPAPIRAAERARWSDDAMAEAQAIAVRWGLDLMAAVGADAVPPGGLAESVLHRVGCLVGIDRALMVALGQDQGRAWMHRPNAGTAFAGRAPAALVQDGMAGLLLVRGILDAMKCGIFAPPAGDAGPPLRFRMAPP